MFDGLKLRRRQLSDEFVQRPLHQIVDRRIQKALGLLHKISSAQVFIDASRQSVVDQIVDFAINALARDENLFQEGKLIVILVDFTLDERPDLLPGTGTGGNVRQMLGDGCYLLINSLLD